MSYYKVSFFILIVLLSGCSTYESFEDLPDSHAIWGEVNNKGRSDAVKTLKEGLTLDHSKGQQDPYNAIINPPVVVPVWVVSRIHPATGEKIQGHWKHLVVKEYSWAD